MWLFPAWSHCSEGMPQTTSGSSANRLPPRCSTARALIPPHEGGSACSRLYPSSSSLSPASRPISAGSSASRFCERLRKRSEAAEAASERHGRWERRLAGASMRSAAASGGSASMRRAARQTERQLIDGSSAREASGLCERWSSSAARETPRAEAMALWERWSSRRAAGREARRLSAGVRAAMALCSRRRRSRCGREARASGKAARELCEASSSRSSAHLRREAGREVRRLRWTLSHTRSGRVTSAGREERRLRPRSRPERERWEKISSGTEERRQPARRRTWRWRRGASEGRTARGLRLRLSSRRPRGSAKGRWESWLLARSRWVSEREEESSIDAADRPSCDR
mmetsp:Transcript_30052/g.73158  ORF Transcript_30052/g.73158 Transcript_30052/m.73158 type:complete len:345 (+) Transcript_30052:216-1250(+)